MPPTSSPVRDERRVVTALFSDIVGSTALGEALDPEELKLVIGDAVLRMIGAVEAYGGMVKDLAGDGLLALFGAPVAHEDDTERAIRAGLQIVEDITAYATEVEQAWGISGFAVRVGVNTGPVVTGAVGGGERVEYSALGDAVNTAARLQSHAEPGSVLVGDETYRLTEQLFAWGEPTELSLKGKAEPIVARIVAPGAPVPRARGFAGVETRFVGRAREVETARRAVNAVVGGTGGILYLVGEPGIGKSRLLTEVHGLFDAARPMHGHTLWLEGRCVSYGESMPYGPFRDLLRSWLGLSAEDPELRVRVTLRRQVASVFGERTLEIYPYLASLLDLTLEPDLAARLRELSPEALQFRTFEVVRDLLARLAQDGPLAVAFEDLHWADATSLQLLERLLADTEIAALLLILTSRTERDHPSWRVKETAARELPHRLYEIALEPLTGDAGRELLHDLVGRDTLPADVQDRILGPAEGNPFFLEELVRSLADHGALIHEGGGWRFVHEVDVEIPPTVEKVILARIDRLSPASRETVLAASVLGRQFGLSLLEAVAEGADLGTSLTDLQRLDLVREAMRWPQPEYRFKHALIQEAAYRTLVTADRNRLHRKAAEWLEAKAPDQGGAEQAGLLAHHWLAASDEEKAARYLTIAGDRARQEYALDEAIDYYRELLPILEHRGEGHAIALVLFKLGLALHMSLRFEEANDTYQRAFGFWTPQETAAEQPSATLRVSTSFLPNDPDPKSAIAWPNIQLCMQLFDRLVEAWPERTLVPSLAERWEISADGLRYAFYLRKGLTWSDGVPLTAHDVEFGIKRVLDPSSPGSSVAIYFVLENGQDYYLRHNDDADSIGVRALDDRTVEFRLVAPAPYFMSVMNRPDAGPQPRHAVTTAGAGWTETGGQVVSGPFRIVSRRDDGLTLDRRDGTNTPRPGNVRRIEFVRERVPDAVKPYGEDELDMITVRYSPRLADLMPAEVPDESMGAAGWSGYLAFDHKSEVTSDIELRRALAHAVDRDAVRAALPVNLVAATGGIVPPALQGHTPDIALRFDPDLAREAMERTTAPGMVSVACLDDNELLLRPVVDSWNQVLGLDVEIHTWTSEQAITPMDPKKLSPIYFTGWLPGYPDPEYFLRLLFQSDSRTNEGGFSHTQFDELIERARIERGDRGRLELFHEADKMAVADRVAVIPLVYGRSLALVKPWVHGWWEFGKSSASFADLRVDDRSPRIHGE